MNLPLQVETPLIIKKNMMKEQKKVKIQPNQKGTQKWKRRARTQGRLSSYLDAQSRQKRLVDEEVDLLAELVVSKKGKCDASHLEKLVEAGSQPRQSL